MRRAPRFVILPSSVSVTGNRIQGWRGDFFAQAGVQLLVAAPLWTLLSEHIPIKPNRVKLSAENGRDSQIVAYLGIQEPEHWYTFDARQLSAAESDLWPSEEFPGYGCSGDILRILVKFPLPSTLFWTARKAPSFDEYTFHQADQASANLLVRCGLGTDESIDGWLDKLNKVGKNTAALFDPIP